MLTVSATNLKNRFGSFLGDVIRTGGPLVIERAGKPVAVMLSIEAYSSDPHRPALAKARRELAREAFGMWSGRDEIDDTWLEDGRDQWRSEWVGE